MRANPNADWTMRDIETICLRYGISCETPTRGSHYALRHPSVAGRLTIPARKPIKSVYIRLLIQLVESVE